MFPKMVFIAVAPVLMTGLSRWRYVSPVAVTAASLASQRRVAAS